MHNLSSFYDSPKVSHKVIFGGRRWAPARTQAGCDVSLSGWSMSQRKSNMKCTLQTNPHGKEHLRKPRMRKPGDVSTSTADFGTFARCMGGVLSPDLDESWGDAPCQLVGDLNLEQVRVHRLKRIAEMSKTRRNQQRLNRRIPCLAQIAGGVNTTVCMVCVLSLPINTRTIKNSDHVVSYLSTVWYSKLHIYLSISLSLPLSVCICMCSCMHTAACMYVSMIMSWHKIQCNVTHCKITCLLCR